MIRVLKKSKQGLCSKRFSLRSVDSDESQAIGKKSLRTLQNNQAQRYRKDNLQQEPKAQTETGSEEVA
jgi:hypothetical protein